MTTPIARPRDSGRDATVVNTGISANKIAAKPPCTTRPASSQPMFGASPIATLLRQNPVTAKLNALR